MPEDALIGPVRRPHNRYLELPGSIHNNEVASKLGFRGGTVAGVHMDQFVPLLLDAFGPAWFETGSRRVATMRMMLRSMKAASPQHYPELAGAGAGAGAGTGASPAPG
jgi:hypothetical protein